MEQVVSPELSQSVMDIHNNPVAPEDIDATFSTSTIDLIAAPLRPHILHVTDEFFAPSSNLLAPTPPISKPGVFVETGAWYDGWETRRHNQRGWDAVVIRIGPAAGSVAGVEIDTAFFTGNHAPAISVEGAYEIGANADKKVLEETFDGWIEILGRRNCGPSQRHAWKVGSDAFGTYEGQPITHVRLRQYPDGGIARFRLYGTALPVWSEIGQQVELSAAINGGIATKWSDQHYGKAGNLLLPGRGKDMGDGWETKRSRTQGHVDWVIIRLGARGTVGEVLVDTMHFRGNFPREVKIELGDFPEDQHNSIIGRMRVADNDPAWVEVASRGDLKPDTEFKFTEGKELLRAEGKLWTHAKLTITPDGGIKRFRIFGSRI